MGDSRTEPPIFLLTKSPLPPTRGWNKIMARACEAPRVCVDSSLLPRSVTTTTLISFSTHSPWVEGGSHTSHYSHYIPLFAHF